MAEYKRMVSYMYQYENGVKKKNVGFARVEAKNGQCKITLHMQLLGQLDSIFPTYLIRRDASQMELIYLGDTVLKSQVMDSKLSANESNIMDSGYELADMGGMLLFFNDKVFFATEWDDKPIILKEVIDAMKPKAKKIQASKEKEEVNDEAEASKEEVSDETVAEAPKEEIDYDTTAATKQDFELEEVLTETENFMNPEPSVLEQMMMPKYKLPRGWKTVERLQSPYDSIASAFSQQAMEVSYMGEVDQTPLEENQNENIIKESQNFVEGEAEDISITASDAEPMNIEREEMEIPDAPTAAHLFQKYPRIYPFEDNEITLCVKIEPKDIGLLPKELWTLSNNSFLMHGFYCYHHLIFAKMKDRFGCRYILGVPGIYHSRERFMARMFGFDGFKSIRKRELRQGDFGYWYVPVSM